MTGHARWTLQHVTARPADDETRALVAAAMANAGEALLLFLERRAADAAFARDADVGGSFPKARLPEPVTSHLCILSATEARWVEVPGVRVAFPFVDIFPDGRVAIAGGRARWRGPGDVDLNCYVYDPKTGARTDFCIGDGLEGFAVDQQGRIWASYFDEGVFGNYGWGGPGPEPIGASGLNCFADDGRLIWRYDSPKHDQSISDCYALNVSGDAVYAYFYADFPLCRIAPDFSRQYWSTPLEGCHAVAVSGDLALFHSQYGDPPSRFYLSCLEDDRVRSPIPVDVSLPDGASLNGARLLARGRCIHVLTDVDWFRGDIEDLRALSP